MWRQALFGIGKAAALLLGAALVMGAAGCASGHAESEAQMAASGREWVERITHVYDPHGAFASIRALRFDYVIRDANYNELSRAKHLWDRSTGDYRYEADASQFADSTFFDDSSQTWKKASLKLPAGALVANVNLNTRRGTVFINGRPQPESLLKYVFDRIDNDGKWLLLPLRLAPPATVQYVNTETRDGKKLANLAVTTPQEQGSSKHDLWIVAVDADGHVAHTGIKSPGSFLALVGVWDMEQSVGGVSLATHRFLGERTIVYEAMSAPASVDAEVFKSATPMLVSTSPSPVTQMKK